MTDPQSYFFEDDGAIPNNPKLPLLVYKNEPNTALTSVQNCIARLEKHGWSNAWVNGIYSYHHYHSNTHEVLVVISGEATVKMGGEKGVLIELIAGDALVIPAGVGHCHQQSSEDFRVVGAYPDGRSYDLCTAHSSGRAQLIENISNVARPELDPVSGKPTPLHNYWTS